LPKANSRFKLILKGMVVNRSARIHPDTDRLHSDMDRLHAITDSSCVQLPTVADRK
jgi:hypothetical protein